MNTSLQPEEKKINQRVLLTKRLLKEGLLRLLQTKPLSKINVSELCREAGINRATFYKHYNTPQEVLEDVAKDMILDIRALSNNPQTVQESLIYLEKICSYLRNKVDIIKLLIHSNTESDISHTFDELSINFWETYQRSSAPKENLDTDSVRLVSTFLTCGGYFLLRQWLLEDIDKTPKEIAQLIFQIISKDYSVYYAK